MSRKVLELSLSAFLIAFTVILIVGIISLRPFFNSSLQVMNDSHSVLQSSSLLINEMASGMVEGKKDQLGQLGSGHAKQLTLQIKWPKIVSKTVLIDQFSP